MFKGASDKVTSHEYGQAIPVAPKSTPGYGKIEGKVPTPRARQPGLVSAPKPIVRRKMSPAQPPLKRNPSSSDAPPTFRDLARLLASSQGKTDGANDQRWQLKFVKMFGEVLSQPAAFADEGVKINDRQAIANHLIQMAVAEAPESKQELLKQQLANPKVREGILSALESAQGDLKSRIEKQPRLDFERVDPNDFTAANLPPALRQTKAYKAFMSQLKSALLLGPKDGPHAIKPLGESLNAVLKTTTKTPNGPATLLDSSHLLALSLADGRSFLQSLFEEARKGASPHEEKVMKAASEEFFRWDFLDAFHHAAAQTLGGKMTPEGHLDIGGTVYKRVRDFDHGHFGSVSLFKKDPSDSKEHGLVAKFPLEDMVQGPAREGRAMVTAKGTGAVSTSMTTLFTGFRTKNDLVLVMPYLPLGSVQSGLTRLDNSSLSPSEKITAKLTTVFDILPTLQRMAKATSQGHHDLATRNLIIGPDAVTNVADFGLTEQTPPVEKGKDRESAKLPAPSGPMPIRWTSPERLRNEPSTTKSDVWSVGMTLWEIVYGTIPFQGLTNDEAKQKILSFDPNNASHLPPPDPVKWPGGTDVKMHALMKWILAPQADQRPSIDQIQERMSRDFPGLGSPEIRKKMLSVLS